MSSSSAPSPSPDELLGFGLNLLVALEENQRLHLRRSSMSRQTTSPCIALFGVDARAFRIMCVRLAWSLFATVTSIAPASEPFLLDERCPPRDVLRQHLVDGFAAFDADVDGLIALAARSTPAGNRPRPRGGYSVVSCLFHRACPPLPSILGSRRPRTRLDQALANRRASTPINTLTN